MKRYPQEGGHRVPGLVRYPGQISKGTVSGRLFIGTDLFPIFCSLSGSDLPVNLKLDGINAFNALLDKQVARPAPYLWIFPAHEDTWFRMPQMSLQSGDYTLLGWFPEKDREQPLIPWVKNSVPVRFELFDMRTDPGQTTDILFKNQKTAQKLSEEMVREWLDIRQDFIKVTGAGVN